MNEVLSNAVPHNRSWLSGSSDDEGSASEGRVPSPPSSDGGGNSLLDTVLLAEWEDRAEQGLFRYDVTACPTKMVPGAYGFVAQFNEGRGSKKRPTEFRVDRVCCFAASTMIAFVLVCICVSTVLMLCRDITGTKEQGCEYNWFISSIIAPAGCAAV